VRGCGDRTATSQPLTAPGPSLLVTQPDVDGHQRPISVNSYPSLYSSEQGKELESSCVPRRTLGDACSPTKTASYPTTGTSLVDMFEGMIYLGRLDEATGYIVRCQSSCARSFFPCNPYGRHRHHTCQPHFQPRTTHVRDIPIQILPP
jgi:hypothetical protein